MKHTVLVVSDGTAVPASLADLLCSEGYHVIQAADESDPSTRVEDAAIDLVLLALRSVEKSQWTILREISAIDPLVPVVVISSSPLSDLETDRNSFSAMIEKPVEIPYLLSSIKSLIRKSGEARKERHGGASSASAAPLASRNGVRQKPRDETASRFFANGSVRRSLHTPLETPKGRFRAPRQVWNGRGQAGEGVPLQELEAMICARDFFL